MPRDRPITPVPISNWLKWEIDAGVHCPACQFYRVVPIEELAAKYGPETPIKSLEPKAVCPRCGHKGATIQAEVRANRRIKYAY